MDIGGSSCEAIWAHVETGQSCALQKPFNTRSFHLQDLAGPPPLVVAREFDDDGNDITNLTPAEKLKKVGIAYILQDNSVFPDMTVEENLLMGGYIKDKAEESYQKAIEDLQLARKSEDDILIKSRVSTTKRDVL